jgi:hypothetical protein
MKCCKCGEVLKDTDYVMIFQGKNTICDQARRHLGEKMYCIKNRCHLKDWDDRIGKKRRQ